MKRHASMNRIYRLVWNQTLSIWVAVAETAKGRGKSGSARKMVAGALALAGSAFLAPLAQAAPTGGQVSAGSGTIAQSGTTTTISQSSQNLAINWQSFGIASNEAVNFAQPNASAIALNRVLGQDPSQILGSLSANGQVFILNPNGVLFGTGSQVNVGGLVASTLSISDADFMAGKQTFSNNGTAGSVVNQGTLTAAQGGYIALLAPEVRNEGVISATLGSAVLAAGDKVTLNLNNGSLISFSIDQGALNALAANKQLIQADGGQVFMSAKAANSLATAVVNNTGIIEAHTIQNINGIIILSGDMQVGTVTVGGTLDASAPNGGNGGTIQVLGNQVGIMGGATINANGTQNGGTILIGGDYQGKNPDVPNAQFTYVAPTASISVDGGVPSILNPLSSILPQGNGGKIIVWADNTTRAYGSFSARGGTNGGNGGLIETSGKQALDIAGANVDASAPKGANGQWLLDPADVTITHGSINALTAGLFDPLTSSSIGDTQINAALNGGTDVTIQTSAGSGGTGAIVVNGTADAGGAVAISNTAGGTRGLTLTTAGTINIHSGASIAGSVGNALNVNLTATGGNIIAGTIDNSGGTTALTGATTLSGTIANGTITSVDPTLNNNNGRLSGVTIGSNLTIGGGGTMWLTNNLTLANGVTVNLGNSQLYFADTGTTHHLATTGTATLNNAGGILGIYCCSGTTSYQIDSGVTVQGYGALNTPWGGDIINAGTIIGNTAGQTLTINPTAFTNNGTVTGNTNISVTTLTNTGTLGGTGNITVGGGSGTFTNAGTLAPGVVGADTTGTLSITGNLVMGAGSNLNIDINSPLAGDYDVLNVSGTANLTTGTLNLAGMGGAGSYTVVNATGGLGGTTFGSLNAGTFTQTPTYTATSLTLAATANSNASIFWDGGAGTSDWKDALNWSNDLAPTSATNLYIGSGAGTVFVTTAGQAGNALTCDGNFTLTAGDLTLAGASTFRGITTINGGTLTGAGALTIATGGTLNWTAGTIAATSAATLTTQSGTTSNVTGGTLGANRTWNNSGTMNLTLPTWVNAGALHHAAGTLNLNGTFTAADLGGFTRAGGSVNLLGTLNNAGNTLDIGSAGLFGTGGLSNLSGVIKNGTVISGDGTVLYTNNTPSGTLDGVTIGGNLTTSASFFVSNGITLDNGAVMNLGAYGLFFNTTGLQNISTLGTSTINSAGGGLHAGDLVAGQTLQINNGVTLQGYGVITQQTAATVINAGTIIGNTAGQTFTINPTTFTNNGTLSVTAGTMTVAPTTFTQSGTINVVSGATFNRAAGFTNTGTLSGSGTIAVGTGASKLVNQGNINPGGTGVAGSLAITGDVMFDTGSNLNMELGGAVAGQFDKLTVSGVVSGNTGSFGSLTLAKINGYTYTNVAGDTFPLLTAASGANTGTFTPFTLASTILASTYAASNFTLVATPPAGATSQTSTALSGMNGLLAFNEATEASEAELDRPRKVEVQLPTDDDSIETGNKVTIVNGGIKLPGNAMHSLRAR